MSTECGRDMGSDEVCEATGDDHSCCLPRDNHAICECECGVTW